MFSHFAIDTILFNVAMVANFVEKRENERWARDAALRAYSVNPARAMEQTLVAVATASGEATPSAGQQTPTGKSPQAQGPYQ